MSADHRGSAVQDGGKHLDMEPGQPLTTAIEECGARRVDNVSHLHGWLRHLLGLGDLSAVAEHRQCIQRAGGSVKMLL